MPGLSIRCAAPGKSPVSFKIYALVGGFHLAPAPDDYLRRVMVELQTFDLEHVLLPLTAVVRIFLPWPKQEIPERLVLCGTGSGFTFTPRDAPRGAAENADADDFEGKACYKRRIDREDLTDHPPLPRFAPGSAGPKH